MLNKITTAAYNSAQGAYGVKLLNTNYTGAIIQLRASTDTAGTSLQDFYSDLLGNLTTQYASAGTSVVNWLSGLSANQSYAYVTKWYDQSVTTINHATQTVKTSQPVYDVANKVINFGYTGAGGGYVTTYNNNAYLNLPTGAIPYADSSYTVIFKHWNVGGVGFINGGMNNANANCLCIRTHLGNTYLEYWGSYYIAGGILNSNNVYSTTYVTGSSQQPIYINSLLAATGTMTSPRTQLSSPNFIGVTNTQSLSPGTEYMNGQLYYMYIFNSSLSNADRIIIEST